MANRLARESSPYLLLHKDNPVDWYPWGEEALARAAGNRTAAAKILGLDRATLRTKLRLLGVDD